MMASVFSLMICIEGGRYFIEDDLSIEFDEHRCWIVDEISGFHDVAIVFDDVFLLEFEDVSAF
jgi:hypothetical protein